MTLRLEMRFLFGACLSCMLIQGCLPSQHSPQSPMFAMSDVTNDLGVCALQLLANSMPGRNIAFSPYGLASVSMLLYEGASGNSALQLRQALQLPYDGLYARVGFRDLYRHLRSYFMSDGFLKGLMLSRENICIRADYMRVLAFYGFDLPEHTSVEPCNGTSSTISSGTVTSSTTTSTTHRSMSMGFTASLSETATISPAIENKETPVSTESIAVTTPSMTTFNFVTSTGATSQGTQPSILEQLTSMTTDPTEVKTTQAMITDEMPALPTVPLTEPAMNLISVEMTTEPSMNLMNVEMTTHSNADSLMTTVTTNNYEFPTNPPVTTRVPDTTVPDGQTSPAEVSTSGAMENLLSTLSSEIGSGENTASGTTPMNSMDKVDTTSLATNVNNGEEMETTVNMSNADLTTLLYIPNVETTTSLNNMESGNMIATPMNNVDATTPAANPEVVATVNMNNLEITTIVPTETSQQSIGTTESSPIGTTAVIMDMGVVNNNEDTTVTSDLASVSTGAPMTTVGNVDQGTANIVDPTQTTPGNKNDKLSTIVEVTVLPPTTENSQVMSEQDGSVTESNTTPASVSDDNISMTLEENPTTTISQNNVDIPTTTASSTIVFNTTPSNKNDKLSIIVEVTVPPPSTVHMDTETSGTTENPTSKIPESPETKSPEILDTTVYTTPSSVDVITTQQATTNEGQPLSTIKENESNESTTPGSVPIVTSIASLTTESEAIMNSSQPPVEALEPVSSMNTLMQHNETLLDGHNPNDQVQIINNIVEDSLAAYMLPPEHGAYIDRAKPSKASIVLNYDYLNPENFQDYVNIVDKNTNSYNDSDPDFTDALIQDAARRNKSLVSHFMDNNQVRYTYESYVNDYAHNLDVRNSRSIEYETPLLHKIKSWIKFKSGYSHIDPLPIAPVTSSFDPALTSFVPAFAAKSAAYPLPGGSYPLPGGSYSQSGGSYSQSGGSYSQPGSSYSQSGGTYSQPGGTYSQSGGSYSRPGESYSRPGESYSRPGESYSRPGESYTRPGGSHSQSGPSYSQSSASYLPSGESYSPSGGYQSTGGSSYHSSVTPSYEPPHASYNRMPEDLDWFLANGRARIVPVMRYSAVLPYAYVDPLDAFALEIPLDDEKYKLLILLPSSSYGLASLLKALPYCSIRAIYSQLRYVSVYATLPVFDVVEQISLTPTLQQLGVSDIFHLSKADLSTMSSDSNLFVRDIMQVVAIYAKKYNSEFVHEVPAHSTQTTFTASHSFVYFVVDNFTKVSLLAGIVEDPARKH